MEGSRKAARGCRPTPRRPPPPTAPNESAGAVSCDLVRSRVISCDLVRSRAIVRPLAKCSGGLVRSGATSCNLMQSREIAPPTAPARPASLRSHAGSRATQSPARLPRPKGGRGGGRFSGRDQPGSAVCQEPRKLIRQVHLARSVARSHLNLGCSRRGLGAVSAQSRPSGGRGLSAGKRASPGRSPSNVKRGCEERG